MKNEDVVKHLLEIKERLATLEALLQHHAKQHEITTRDIESLEEKASVLEARVQQAKGAMWVASVLFALVTAAGRFLR